MAKHFICFLLIILLVSSCQSAATSDSSGSSSNGPSSSGYNCPVCPISKTGVIRVSGSPGQNQFYYDTAMSYCNTVAGYNDCLISGNFTKCGGSSETIASISGKAQNACNNATTNAKTVCTLMTGYTWTGNICKKTSTPGPIAVH